MAVVRRQLITLPGLKMIVFESSCLVFTGADGSVVATFHGAFVD
jgi:hypothetical protein